MLRAEAEWIDLSTADVSELVTSLLHALRVPGAPHYKSEAAATLEARCASLVGRFAAGVAGRPLAFVAYVKSIASIRWADGYPLYELQLALTALESRAWDIVVRTSDAGSLRRRLMVVTTVIGAAKDALARVYVEHAAHASRSGRVEAGPLFAGTEGHVEPDMEAS